MIINNLTLMNFLKIEVICSYMQLFCKIPEIGKGGRGLAANGASLGKTGKQGAKAAPNGKQPLQPPQSGEAKYIGTVTLSPLGESKERGKRKMLRHAQHDNIGKVTSSLLGEEMRWGEEGKGKGILPFLTIFNRQNEQNMTRKPTFATRKKTAWYLLV